MNTIPTPGTTITCKLWKVSPTKAAIILPGEKDWKKTNNPEITITIQAYDEEAVNKWLKYSAKNADASESQSKENADGAEQKTTSESITPSGE